ncbi:pirin family protein [Corynebacterium pseudopelargi]|uniref:Quercetin 2,3-dioxygenase n=1 Tax=Corynebacterium pseudopelargi TaxID=2080757 RepID=A0A3G6ISQ5_9CORY|nr:pirin family protein [Corynebacterium pseudopelargi]AZA08671.1 Quercetin 2,3-dioxygenase [Corynebacterium pseudopelargi]
MTAIERITSRKVPLGGPRAMTVHRTLPHRQRPTIGAWCFADHYGPDELTMDVPPHPHTGLQTVSWLFEGEIKHDDAGNNHAIVHPGDLVIMTAGHGISHSEVSQSTRLHGVQLWTVLPEEHRDSSRRLDVYKVPRTELDCGYAHVFLGSLLGQESPVQTFTPLLGAEIVLNPKATLRLELNPTFEHGVLVDTGRIDIEGEHIAPTELAYMGIGEDHCTINNTGDHQARIVILGGEPFEEPFVMWWNFIGRSHQEIARYREQWQHQDPRFGSFEGYQGKGPAWLPAPALPNAEMRARVPSKPRAQVER